MKQSYNRFQRALAALLLVPTLLLGACKGDSPDNPGGGTKPNPGGGTTGGAKLEVVNNPEHIDFRPDAESRDVSISSSESSWRVREKVDVPWLEVSRVGSAIRIVVQENSTQDVRTAQLLLMAGQLQKEVSVRQIGALPRILVSKSVISVPTAGGPVDFTVTTNVPKGFDIKTPEWMTLNEGRAAMIETSHSYTASGNKTEASRSANIEVVEKGATGREPVKATIAVSQTGLGQYESYSAEKITEDTKLRIASGSASSEQVKEEITKAFDGDYASFYHSNWSRGNAAPDYFPITLTFNLDAVKDVDYMVYYPRQDSHNGHFKVVDIEYSEDGSTFKPLMRKDFGGVSTPSRVKFDAPVRAKSFRLIVRSGAGDGQGFATAAEIEFYQKNPAAFSPLTLFTDETCSALKANVTEQDVQKCPDEFFRNLAYYMLQKKYDTTFRLADYKAYTDPEKHRRNITKMQFAYSIFDNPTGIYVDQNETLVALVGDTHGQENLSITVVDYHAGSNGDGVWQRKNYPLQRGVNKIKMTGKGLVYVLYFKDSNAEARAAQPIKIHFAGGKVNGYYDNENPAHKNRWTELLGKATHPYFDLVGKSAHMAFPTSVFRAHTPDGAKLIELYDKVVLAEQELHGLIKYDRNYMNRMMMMPVYSPNTHMYATHFHTAYGPHTLNAIANELQSRTTDIWGQAHEMGHIHQTAPAVLWAGLTECTVNIPSAYVQTTILGQQCRLQIEDTGAKQNRYTRAFSHIIAKGAAHGADADVFRKLVPFWQLQLYFGKVLSDTPEKKTDKDGFYPRVFEYARTNVAPSGDGANQVEFAFIASKEAKMDLTSFFEKWGFFAPVRIEIDDYGKKTLVVTEEQANNVKRRIASLGLPKPDVALEYITDRTYELYNTKPAIQRGTATRSGNEITLKGWRNVVAYEVYNADDKLVFVGDGVWTDGKTYGADGFIKLDIDGLATWQTGYKVKAVSASGQRVDVTF